MFKSPIEQKSVSYLSDVDVHLMLEVKKGDQASFESLMHKYYKRILNFIYRFVGNREVAEDLTQEVFIKVYQAARTYQPKAKFQTWIYTIAKNTSLNELRKRKYRQVSLDDVFEVKDSTVQRQVEDTAAANPAEVLEEEERKILIRNAIMDLPESQRLALILRRYENFSYEEIAVNLNTSVSAVKSLLNRAKKGLRAKLTKAINTI